MRGIFEHAVALQGHLERQTKFSVLKIVETRLCNLGRAGTGTGTEIATLNQQDIHTVDCQIAKDASAINACANNQNLRGFGF